MLLESIFIFFVHSSIKFRDCEFYQLFWGHYVFHQEGTNMSYFYQDGAWVKFVSYSKSFLII